jgi:DNA-binding NarL/FixJ family response regulator
MTLALERPSIGSEFSVAVRSATLARALTLTGRAAGWVDADTRGNGDLFIADTVDALHHSNARYRILVVEPTAKACRVAVDAITSASADAVVLSDRLDQLDTALQAIRNGHTPIPARAIELAMQLPSLTARHVQILQAILAGQTNKHLSRGLGLSPASIKRELTELYRLLGAGNRLELAHCAMTLGYLPQRLAG